MPKSCGDCPMFHEGWADCFCSITWMCLDYPQYCKERDKTCPLVEVKNDSKDRRITKSM